MFLSVCIPAFNEEKQIAGCIESIIASFGEAGHPDYEIVVCDNNSSDQTARVAQSMGARTVFEPHNQIARARNAAAGAATGEWLVFIDADSRLNATLLRATIGMMKNPSICAGGAVIRFDSPNLPRYARRILKLWNWLTRWTAWAAGSYLFCRREAWRETGGFGEEYYAAEEIVFSRRLQRWGRPRKMRMRVIQDAAIITSARKFDMFSAKHLQQAAWRLLRPGSLKNRDNCDIWYRRPSELS